MELPADTVLLIKDKLNAAVLLLDEFEEAGRAESLAEARAAIFAAFNALSSE